MELTAPKPFVFVLMPFKPEFADIYRYGIQGSADEVGAYAERVDEQIFDGRILDRIYNQISKADIVVADTTGQNANVFYELGYAHALGKLVLLITRAVDDIPFDLRHHPHIVYEGKIEKLRQQLIPRLKWAINEVASKRPRPFVNKPILTVSGIGLPETSLSQIPPAIVIMSNETVHKIEMTISNPWHEPIEHITHSYLLHSTSVEPIRFGNYITKIDRLAGFRTKTIETFDELDVRAEDKALGFTKMFRLAQTFLDDLPPYGADKLTLGVGLSEQNVVDGVDVLLRLCLSTGACDYKFRLEVMAPPK